MRILKGRREGLLIDATSVQYEVEAGIATITLTREAALNAMDRPMRQELRRALEAAQDPAVRAVILTGAGRAFSVGQDLAELTRDYQSAGPQLARLIYDEWAPLVRAVRDLPKPVIAAVNGTAAGGGLSLALACDVRLGEPRTALLAAFVNVGLVPDSGAAHMLVRMVGLSRAMALVLRGEPLPAVEAERWGLLAEVAADADAMRARARAWAERFAAGPPLAYGAIKQVMHEAADEAFEHVVDAEARRQDLLGRSEDHREAIAAFLEKRRPAFRAR